MFERLFATGSADVLAGTHRVDEPPVEGGRWPVTVVSLVDDASAARLDDWTSQLVPLVGPDHFLTGRAQAVHLTVRSLEPYREAAAVSDPIVPAWMAALDATTAECVAEPMLLHHTGFTLTSGTVMAQLEPADSRPWQLMANLDAHLGELGWYEANEPRTIWYANLIHFTGPISDPAALVTWVEQRRRIDPTPVWMDNLSLVRSRHRGWTSAEHGPEQAMVPELWHQSRWC